MKPAGGLAELTPGTAGPLGFADGAFRAAIAANDIGPFGGAGSSLADAMKLMLRNAYNNKY